MLKKILSISGKPGLYKLISQGKNMLIVQAIPGGKRMPAYGNEKIVSLGDIAIYTNDEDVPLREVLASIKTKYEGKPVDIDPKSVTPSELRTFLEEVLPDFDRDRVHASDIRKLVQWYNLLVECGEDDFSEEQQ